MFVLLLAIEVKDKMSRVVRKPAFCICENKDADQLLGNREADHCLCFCYTDSTIPLLPKSKISSFYPSSVTVQLVCVGPGRTPRRLVFSQQGSNYICPLASYVSYFTENHKHI